MTVPTLTHGDVPRPWLAALGAGLLALGIAIFAGLSSALAGLMMLVGVILLLTGVVGYCPLFTVIGVNTCTSTSDPKRPL